MNMKINTGMIIDVILSKKNISLNITIEKVEKEQSNTFQVLGNSSKENGKIHIKISERMEKARIFDLLKTTVWGNTERDPQNVTFLQLHEMTIGT